MKLSHSHHQSYQTSYSKEDIKQRRSGSQTEKHKQFKRLALDQKRISQMQILNKNLKRKLSLYNQLQSGPNPTSSNITKRPQPASVPNIDQRPSKSKLQHKDKFTNYEQKVIDNYRQQVEQGQKPKQGNPFEIALAQMIEKEQEVVLKRKKDMEFWRNKVRSLELIYHQLNKTGLNPSKQIA